MATVRIDFASKGGTRVTKNLQLLTVELEKFLRLQTQINQQTASDTNLAKLGAAIAGLATQYQKQGNAARQKAAGEAEAARQAEQLFRTNAALTKQRVAEEYQRQADAIRQQAEAARSLSEGMQQLNQVATLVTRTLAGIASTSLQGFAQFEFALQQIAVTSGASEEALASINDEVTRLGIVTSATPQQVADVGLQLSRAGFNANELEASLEGVIRASEATGASLEQTGDAVSQILRAFQLDASESDDIADVLTVTANNTNTTVDSLAESFKLLAPTAVATNQSVEEMAIALGLLGDAGLRGSIAGTNLTQALVRLQVAAAASDTELEGLVRSSQRQAEALQLITDVGDIVNDSGGLVEFSKILPVLQEGLENLPESDQGLVLEALFGRQGRRAFESIFNVLQETPERLETVTREVQNRQGAAVESGEQLLDTFQGSLVLLDSSLSTLQNNLGEFLAASARPLVDIANELVKGFLRLPAPLQDAAFAVGGLGAAVAAAVSIITAYNLAVQSGVAISLAAASAETAKQAATVATQTITLLASIAQQKYTVSTIVSTAAEKASTLAKLASAAASGKLVLALQKQGLAAGASVAAIAGVVAVLALLANEFNAIDGEAQKFRDGTQEIDEALQQFRDSAEANTQAIEDNRNAITRSLDAFREWTGFLDTSVEAALNRNRVAFLDLVDSALEVEGEFNDFDFSIDPDSLGADELEEFEEDLGNLEAAIQSSIKALEASQPENEADIAIRDAQIARLRDQIEFIDEYRNGVDEATEAIAAQTDVVDQGNEVLQRRLEQLQQQAIEEQALRESGVTGEEERRAGEAQTAQDEFDINQEDIQAAFEFENELRSRAFEEEIARREEAFTELQEGLQADQEEFEAKQQQRLEEFNQRQQAEEEEFNQRQRDAEEAFAEAQRLEEEAFNDQLNEAQTQVDRAIQLRFADDGEERRNLQQQFREEDQIAAYRERLEAPLREAQRQFEEQQRLEERKFEQQQRLEQQTFEEQQRQARVAFETQLDLETEARRLQIEETIATRRRELDAEIQSAQDIFDEAQRIRERDFAIQQRDAQRAFEEEQRSLDEQSAQRIRQILESTVIPAPAVPGAEDLPGLRTGGAMEPGQLYRVHRDEIITTSPTPAYVLNRREAQRIAQQALTQNAIASQPIDMQGLSMTQMHKTLKEVARVNSLMLQELKRNHFNNLNQVVEVRQGDRVIDWRAVKRAALLGMV